MFAFSAIWRIAALGVLLAAGSAIAPSATRVSADPGCRAENMSQTTSCKEEDNVNVPIYDPSAKTFQITATHPTYEVGVDNCAPEFSGCTGGGGGGQPDVCSPLWDDGTNVIHVCTVDNWWLGESMSVSVGLNSLNGHYLQWYRKIADEASWPQVLVLYQDGNARLKPHPPLGRPDVCFGSSVIVGPAVVDERPYARVAAVTVDPATFTLRIDYVGGGSASVALTVDRVSTAAEVAASYEHAASPLAVVRSMWVEDGNSDVDHVQAKAGSPPILAGWTSLSGPWWLFYREARSTHNTSAPDIRVDIVDRNPVGGIAEPPAFGAEAPVGPFPAAREGGASAALASVSLVAILAAAGVMLVAGRRIGRN